jgi:hypothetical protein
MRIINRGPIFSTASCLTVLLMLSGIAGMSIPTKAQAGCWGVLPFLYCSLDRKGTGGSCHRKCKVTAITSVPSSHQKAQYSFLGACWHEKKGAAACPPNPGADSMRIQASWNDSTKVAVESVSFKAWGNSGPSYIKLFTTYSKCGINPWASRYHGCRIFKRIGKDSIKEGVPFSAGSLTEKQYNWLRDDFVRGLTPTIKVPHNSQSFEGGKVLFQASIGIPSEMPNRGHYMLAVEFSHLAWPGMPKYKMVRIIKNIPDSNFVLFSQELKSGNWSVKARRGLPAPSGPWSKSVNFKIE